MRISDLIKMGLRNLSRRKARTALTITGVIIGTISIVVMISIGIGMKANYQSGVMEQGSLTTITVEKYSNVIDSDGNWIDMKEQKIDDSLVRQIREMDHVKAVTPIISTYIEMKSGKYMGGANIYAMDSSTFEEFDFPNLTTGIYPTKANNETIVFGSDSLQYFWAYTGRNHSNKAMDITKDKITFGFDPYRYQVSEKKKPFSMKITDYAVIEKTNNWEYDYAIYMDLDYFKSLYKKYTNTLKMEDRKKAVAAIESYERIKLNVDNVKYVDEVQQKISDLGYQSSSLSMQLKPMEETSNMLQMVLGGIGTISLLVSAINIANTMIMSIYERTKEIGIMKVLGCIIHDIRKLFLFEAGIIGLLGGGIGVIISYIASWGINKFGQPLFKALLSTNYMYNLENAKFSIIPWWLPVLAAGTAMIIGIISGFYPALRATKISAIEAMKTDG